MAFDLSHSTRMASTAPSSILHAADITFIFVVFDVLFPPMLHMCLNESATLSSIFHTVDCHGMPTLRPFLAVCQFADEVTKHIGFAFMLCLSLCYVTAWIRSYYMTVLVCKCKPVSTIRVVPIFKILNPLQAVNVFTNESCVHERISWSLSQLSTSVLDCTGVRVECRPDSRETGSGMSNLTSDPC